MSIPASTTNTTSALHEYRRAKGLSLRQLAELTGIYHSKISNIEHGLRPSEDEVKKLAAALDCRVTDLTPDTHPNVASNSRPKSARKEKSPAGCNSQALTKVNVECNPKIT